MLVAGIVAVFLVIVALKSMVVVPAETAFVVERLGRYHRTLPPGRHFIAPIVDRVANRFTTRAAHGQVSESAITHDNVPVRIESAFRWQIADPAKAATGASDVDAFVDGVIRAQARVWVSKRLWKDVAEATRQLESDVAESANDAAATVGVRVVEISVQRLERA